MTKSPGSYLRAALFGVLSIAASASMTSRASNLDGPPQVRVNYADLNVASAAGAQTLYKRITIAANSVCPTVTKDLATIDMRAECMKQAVGGAVREANIPELSKLFTEHNGIEVAEALGIDNSHRIARN